MYAVSFFDCQVDWLESEYRTLREQDIILIPINNVWTLGISDGPLW
jgi:hypothetical protein